MYVSPVLAAEPEILQNVTQVPAKETGLGKQGQRTLMRLMRGDVLCTSTAKLFSTLVWKICLNNAKPRKCVKATLIRRKYVSLWIREH